MKNSIGYVSILGSILLVGNWELSKMLQLNPCNFTISSTTYPASTIITHITSSPPYMKKVLFIFGCFVVIAIIIAVAVVYFLLPKGETFTLLIEKGTVYYKEEGKEYVKAEGQTLELPNNAYLKTEGAYAHVILPDKSMISLDQNTEILITFDGNSTEIKQFLGKTWHRVHTLTQDEDYTVTTSTAVAAVRGTKFNVDSADPLATYVYSIQDTVEVAQLESGKGTDELTYRSVSDGYIAEVVQKPVEEIPVFLAYIEIDKDAWYKRNLLIDKLYDEGNLDTLLEDILNDSTIQGTQTNGAESDEHTTTDDQQTIEDGSKVIHQMFEYINNAQYSDAALLLGEDMVGNDPPQANSQLQAWAVTFSNWATAKITVLEKADESNWTKTSQMYKVTFALSFKDQGDKAMWEESNTRWFVVEKVGESWMISDIATSI